MAHSTFDAIARSEKKARKPEEAAGQLQRIKQGTCVADRRFVREGLVGRTHAVADAPSQPRDAISIGVGSSRCCAKEGALVERAFQNRQIAQQDHIQG